jgi:hypothetical protein
MADMVDTGLPALEQLQALHSQGLLYVATTTLDSSKAEVAGTSWTPRQKSLSSY